MKRVLITGATRGLGREMAEYFRDRGWKVDGCGRSPNAPGIPPLEGIQLREVDVSDDDAVRRWASEILAAGEAPDLVLNNAAIIAHPAPLWEIAAAEAGRVIDINLKGTIHVIRHFLPSMISRGSGVVVNFSSGWGRSTSPEVALYCATKWAVEGLTSALAQELPRGLAAVALNPGIIATDMLIECWGEAAKTYPTAGEWIVSAGPFLEKLSARDNGRSLTVPGACAD